MARKDKYNKNKPKVSPITLVIVGLVFIGLILTIVLSIDTPKQKFDKSHGLEENVYKLQNFKKVNKEIESGKKVVVMISMVGGETNPTELLHNVNDAYFKQNDYENYKKEENKLNELIDVIYFVEIKDIEVLKDFYDKHDEIVQGQFPTLLSFNNEELVVAYKDIKNSSELENAEQKLIVRNTAQFFVETTKAFTDK